jgi:hypothetical protein
MFGSAEPVLRQNGRVPCHPVKSCGEETTMTNTEKPASISPEEMADMEAVSSLIAEGKRVTDTELLKRIRERSEAAQRATFEKHGVVEWAVDLIREARDEE